MLDTSILQNKSIIRNTVHLPRATSGNPARRHKTPDPAVSRLKIMNKYIQQHNVQQILGNTNVVYDYKRGDYDIALEERREISNNLNGVKKKFDETKDILAKKEKEINWMRAEIDKLKISEEQAKEDKTKDNSKLEQLQNAVDTQALRLEEIIHQRNSYIHIADRLKEDKLVDKKKLKILEKEFNKNCEEFEQEEAIARKAKQFHLQTKSVFEDILKQVEQDEKNRQQSLHVFESTMNSKEEVEKKREDRIKRTQTIAENAAAEIRDGSQKRWRELLLVHKFVASFIKKKMANEMNTYGVYERVFQKIKASTGLVDPKEVVSKFIRREEIYSELLISIATYEKKIQELKKDNENLKAQANVLRDKAIDYEKNQKARNNYEGNLSEIYRDLSLKTETYKTAKLKFEKIRDWSIKTMIRIDKAQGITKNDYYQDYPKEKVGDAFLNVLESARRYREMSKQMDDVSRVLAEAEAIKMDEIEDQNYIEKNVRVRASATKRERSDSRSESKLNLSREESEGGNDDQFEDEEGDDFMNDKRKEIRGRVAEELAKKKKQREKEEEDKKK